MGGGTNRWKGEKVGMSGPWRHGDARIKSTFNRKKGKFEKRAKHKRGGGCQGTEHRNLIPRERRESQEKKEKNGEKKGGGGRGTDRTKPFASEQRRAAAIGRRLLG